VVALVGLALALTGFAVAGPTLAVPGAGLVLVGGFALLWVLAATAHLEVDAWALASTVVDGQPLGITIDIAGSRLLGHSGAVLVHELLAEPVPLRRSGRVEVDARARGRGALTVAPPQVSVGDPLGLAHGTRRARQPVGTLLVLPRTEPVRWLDAGMAPSGSGAPVGLVAGPQTIDLAGLREYRPGTPATRIHWPALARGGELLERVFATETERVPLLAIDPRCGDPIADAALIDVVVAATASLTLALATSGGVDLLLPGAPTPLRITDSLLGWPAALRALALLPAAPREAAPPRVPAGNDGILFYACAEPGLAAAAQHRWAGRLFTLAPPFPSAPAPGEMTPASPRSGGVGQAAVLEVAGCVARPVWGGA
jgi:uncharacterized protein (DUF58 family)